MSSIKSSKDKILEKIDEKINEMLRKLDRNPDISSYDAVNLGGEQGALYRLKTLISSIDIKVPPDVPQYLDTGDKFLNAAYHQAVLVKGSPETFEGDVGGLGKEGKDDVIEEMMDYIKSLVE
jgi:hypothetical protein